LQNPLERVFESIFSGEERHYFQQPKSELGSVLVLDKSYLLDFIDQMKLLTRNLELRTGVLAEFLKLLFILIWTEHASLTSTHEECVGLLTSLQILMGSLLLELKEDPTKHWLIFQLLNELMNIVTCGQYYYQVEMELFTSSEQDVFER
jgi:hypothetical protein